MKKKLPAPFRRLPIDFGDEPVFLIPIRKWAPPFGQKKAGRTFRKVPFRPPLSGSPEGCGKLAGDNIPGYSAPMTSRPGEALEFDLKFRIQHSKLPERAFTLVEILVVLALLSLIVFALMAVFAATQRAFRASLTQTDTLEGGRAVMDLIAGDLEAMAPSYGVSNTAILKGNLRYTCPINFSVNFKTNLFPPSPLYQPLMGSPTGAQRTNILEDIFILSKGNINGVSSWIGTGYSVTTNLADGTLYPLYRFYMTTNAASGAIGQNFLFTMFNNMQYTNSASWSHLMDGVVNLTARTYDTNGVWMTNGYANPSFVTAPHNVSFFMTGLGETSCFFFSNAVPGSVSIVMGTIEDHVLKHAEALNGVNQSAYLENSVGQVHLFSRRVWIRNVDPTAYQ